MWRLCQGGATAWSDEDVKLVAIEHKWTKSDENGDPSLHNTFAYDRTSNSWRWTIDNVDRGQLEPFANVKLTRQ